MKLQCIHCGSTYPPKPILFKCKKCNGILEYTELDKKWNTQPKTTGFWKYKNMLPPTQNTISLGEGATPTHKAQRLAESIKIKNLYLKDETRNPTHSYRDRAAALLTSQALDLQADATICATNGNMGASLAAYSAKAGIICHAIVPKLVDVGKLAQMIAYDAVIEEHGNIVDDAINHAQSLAKETGWYQATAELNPMVVEAQKTISYEIHEHNKTPEFVIVSMGSGGTIYSLWKGFKELKEIGLTDSLPKMIGVQPEGCSSIVDAIENPSNTEKTCSPYTRALAVLVGNPLQNEMAEKAINESNGLALKVSDSEILKAEMKIAKLEGVFAEPASSATIAAAQKLLEMGVISNSESVVCLITGSGLKATDVLQVLTKKQKTAVLGLDISTKEKILKILCKKDSYGYDIWKILGKTITRAAVYQHLNELSEKGLIVSYEKDGKKFFRIAERGQKALQAMEELKVLF